MCVGVPHALHSVMYDYNLHMNTCTYRSGTDCPYTSVSHGDTAIYMYHVAVRDCYGLIDFMYLKLANAIHILKRLSSHLCGYRFGKW